jgi:hypothetical protein
LALANLANLANLAMAMAMVLTAAARQAKQLGNPSCLVSKAAAATSLSKTGTAPSAVAGNRYGDARGAAREGSAGASRPADRRPTSTRRQAGWQGRWHATCPCLCWWGAAGAVGWRWPADDRQPAVSCCSSFSAWGTGCLGVADGLLSWSVLSGTPPDGDRPSLGSAVPFVAASQRWTSRPPWQAQLMGNAGLVGAEMLPTGALEWMGARSPRGREVASEPS